MLLIIIIQVEVQRFMSFLYHFHFWKPWPIRNLYVPFLILFKNEKGTLTHRKNYLGITTPFCVNFRQRSSPIDR